MTKTEDKDKDKDKDKTIPKTIVKIKDKDKTATKTKTEDKDKYIGIDENKPIQVFQYASVQGNKKNGDWVKRQIVWVFWNDEHISEICEKWIRCGSEYAYTWFEELRTYSGEVLFTREHKATRSNRKSNKKNLIYINKLQVFKFFINNK